MSEHYRQSLRQLQSLLEPGLRRMLLLSFFLHLIVPVILSGVLKITHKTPQLPVYRVNLVNKPVENPRAGRPDAAPTKKKKKKKSVKKKVAAKKVVTKKTPKVKTAPLKKKSAPTKKKSTAAKSVKPDKSAQKALKDRLAEMQAKAERQKKFDDLKAAIAAQQADLGKPDIQAPVGDPEGTGNEIGVKATRYVEGFIKEQWRLSKYQLPNLDLEVEAKLSYSKEGVLGFWKIVTPSGNVFFDDSVKKAILRSKYLGQPLPVAGTFEIIFNLKDLQTQ